MNVNTPSGRKEKQQFPESTASLKTYAGVSRIANALATKLVAGVSILNKRKDKVITLSEFEALERERIREEMTRLQVLLGTRRA